LIGSGKHYKAVAGLWNSGAARHPQQLPKYKYIKPGIAWSVTGTLPEYITELSKSLSADSPLASTTYDQYLSTLKSLP
jgi:hypothetical protein